MIDWILTFYGVFMGIFGYYLGLHAERYHRDIRIKRERTLLDMIEERNKRIEELER